MAISKNDEGRLRRLAQGALISRMKKKLAAQKELKILLQAGYELQVEKDVFQVHRVPRSWEPGFTNKSMREYLHFGASGHIDYKTYTYSIKNTFVVFGLNFTKFTSRTETINSKVDPDSPAGLLTRQLRELESITTELSIFESYILPSLHEKVEFEHGVISQGLEDHKFRDNKHRDLVRILWDRRQIKSPNGEILKKDVPTTRNEVYKKLSVDHERFKDIVRAIKIEMKRKNIDLDVKFPKDVVLVVVQDSM